MVRYEGMKRDLFRPPVPEPSRAGRIADETRSLELSPLSIRPISQSQALQYVSKLDLHATPDVERSAQKYQWPA